MRSFKKSIIGAIVISSLSLVFNGIIGVDHKAYADVPAYYSTELAGGEGYSLSLASNGTVWGWGNNSGGSLGDGTNTDRLEPVKVDGLLAGKAVSEISARYMHSLAIADGLVYGWGINNSGQLGDATIKDRNVPVKVNLPSGKIFSQIATGMTHSLALTSTGILYAWGNNDDGQLGDGTTNTRATPVLVNGLPGKTIIAIAAGNLHSVAVAQDGTVWAWGNNSSGQLGDGTNTNRKLPVKVIGLSGKTAIKVAAGNNHTLALVAGGTVWGSGNNSSGQLGDGTTINRTTSVKVNGLLNGKTIIDITAENDHSLALLNDRTMMSWGENDQGQLGDGSTSSSNLPVTVSALDGKLIYKISSGAHHSLATDDKGVVWTWGGNNSGELGDGSTVSTLTAIRSLADTTVAIAADKTALTLGFRGSDNATKVTQDIDLTTEGANGSTVTWASYNPLTVAISTYSATVTRPTDADVTFNLTATLKKGDATTTQVFPIKVLQTDEGAVETARLALVSTFSAITDVTQNLDLPITGLNGTTINWSSDNAAIAVVGTKGVVSRAVTAEGGIDGALDVNVTLEATISKIGTPDKTQDFVVKVLDQKNSEALAEASSALLIGYTGSESAASVSRNVTLPIAGLNGTTVSWSANPTGIIADSTDPTHLGIVTMPAAITVVKLTATISKNGTTATKVFDLSMSQTDAGAVAQTKDSVTLITYSVGSSDTRASVTQRVYLKTSDTNGTTITWVSSNPAVISTTGLVTRPASANAVVTLTATIKKNSATATIAIPLTVIMTDVGTIPAAKAALAITYATGDSLAKVTRNLSLPDIGLNGTVVTWASNKPLVVSASGEVFRPTDADATVILTANLTKNLEHTTKDFTLKIFQTDQSAVAAAKAALAISYGVGDNVGVLLGKAIKNMKLATVGTNGTTIQWISSSPTVISATGIVTRNAFEDVTVTLTAKISKTSIPNSPEIVEKKFDIIVPQSELGAIIEDKAEIVIGFGSGDSAAKVTQSLSLPKTGLLNTTAITWTSSAPAVVNPSSGVVKRPTTADAIVNLTATVRKGTVVSTKIYKITVPQTDASALDAAQRALVLKFFKGDNALSVTNTVYLTPTGLKGTTIVWSSDTPGAIDNDGVVKRLPDNNAVVTLKATLSKDGSSVSKEFVVKVPQIDSGAVANTKAALISSGLTFAPGETKATVKGKITLPTKGSNGATITWKSDQTKVVNAAGAVARQAEGDTTVKLTATIKKNAVIDGTQEFTVNVLQSDLGVANLAKANVAIGYNSGDTQGNVTHNLTLPLSGDHGTVVSWTSSNEALISSVGGVNQVLAKETNVTLTATIKKNTSSVKATFILTVPNVDVDATAAAKTILAIGYSSGDKVNNVTKDLKLPLIAANKAVVTWSSNNTDVVSNAGIVTRDAIADTKVVLTATMTIAGASFSRDYPIIVIQSDAGAIAAAKSDLVVSYTGLETDARITQNIVLLKVGIKNTTITWTSNSPAINTAGVITRQLTGNKTVTLIASIKKNGLSDTKEFVLVVPQSDQGAVNQDKAALVIGFSSGDTALAVKDDLTLASSGTSGSTITWLSSDTSVISNSGIVSPVVGKKIAIKLTATITKNAITTTKVFALSV
ncbi:immunoglobulin-like domain-containing protein [Paenibacillus psychroresistens]|nr:immunoglobulin-like domain-containing protein [Paenibacillus psychroresistens]